ncbi:hypothetical protein LINPERPRIM_LOCUS25373, partial [Linum perenne]
DFHRAGRRRGYRVRRTQKRQPRPRPRNVNRSQAMHILNLIFRSQCMFSDRKGWL